MIRVLLIEDDPNIARVIKYYLAQEECYDVRWVTDAEAALDKACAGQDIILLDVMLPGMDGIELCSRLRQWYHCPILFISCLSDTATIIRALESGGDDYLVKPFDNQVLHAKIQATLRRVRLDRKQEPTDSFRCGDLAFDPEAQTVTRGGETVHLLAMEARLLAFLMQHPDSCFPAAELYRQVWEGQPWGDARTVTVHIYNLRQKIEQDAKHPRYIKNVWGRGYGFDPDGSL